jgi:hypothetical protein
VSCLVLSILFVDFLDVDAKDGDFCNIKNHNSGLDGK